MKTIEQKAKKVPAIRFAGFDDEWEKLSFADVGNVCMCKRVFKEETSDKGDIPFYKIGTFGGIPDAYITKELYNEYRTKFSYPEKGDILLSAAGTIGRIVEYDGESAYFQDSNIVWLSHDKSITNKFLKVLYPTLKWGGIEGSTIQRLYNDIFLKTPFFKPTISEQQKIGSFFSNIDSLISLEQKKYDKLTQVKKSMLEKMFPKEGATVPEIRFAGFTGEWDEKKLCEIADRITRKNQNLESNLPLTISAQYGLIDQNEFFDKRIASKDISGYYLVKNGEFAYNKSTSAEAPWGAVKRLDRYEMGVLSTLYIVFGILENKQTDSNYLATYFNTNLWHKEVQLVAAEGARNHGLLNISADDFLQIDIMIPKNLNEQQKIGSYFSHLDSLISLQQRKLEKLKNIKKSLLEKMFV